MAKGKSSASSATRKKHAKKAHANDGDSNDEVPQQPPQRGQKKVKKDRLAPKVKSFVQPPPPPKTMDPVDTYLNGGADIDPELVVFLRKLGKKDEATILKGIEGLEAWIRTLIKKEADEVVEDDKWIQDIKKAEMISSLTVWAYHFSRLAMHSSRRLRLQFHTVHYMLVKRTIGRPSAFLDEARKALLAPVWIEQREYVGAWCCSTFDADRTVRETARRSWDQVIQPSIQNGNFSESMGIDLRESFFAIMEFSSSVLSDPIYPSAEVEGGEDPAFLKAQALSAIAYLLNTIHSPLPDLREIAGGTIIWESSELWDQLHPDQPLILRRGIYQVLGSIAKVKEQDLLSKIAVLTMIAQRVLSHCWRGGEGWADIIAFLQRYPEAWRVAFDVRQSDGEASSETSRASSDHASDEEETASREVTTETPNDTQVKSFVPNRFIVLFLEHLRLACNYKPSSYPTILLILSTIPSDILPSTTETIDVLFQSFWEASRSKLLKIGAISDTPFNKATAPEEFISAFLECLYFEISKLFEEEEISRDLLIKWVGKAWSWYIGVENDLIGDGNRRTNNATETGAKAFSSLLSRLAGKHEVLFRPLWEDITEQARTVVATANTEISLNAIVLSLEVFSLSSSPLQISSECLAQELIELIARFLEQHTSASSQIIDFRLTSLNRLRCVAGTSDRTNLTISVMSLSFFPQIFRQPERSVDNAAAFAVSLLLRESPSNRNRLWNKFFEEPVTPQALVALQEQLDNQGLRLESLPQQNLDAWAFEILSNILVSEQNKEEKSKEVQVTVLVILLTSSGMLMSDTGAKMLLAKIALTIEQSVTKYISKGDGHLDELHLPIQILAQAATKNSDSLCTMLQKPLELMSIMDIAYILPFTEIDFYSSDASKNATVVVASLLTVDSNIVEDLFIQRLKRYLVSCKVHITPPQIVSAYTKFREDNVQVRPEVDIGFLPTSAEFTQLLNESRLSLPSEDISILSPLVPAFQREDPVKTESEADTSGSTSYIRAMLGVLEFSSRDRNWVRHNVWVLPHALLLALVVTDNLSSQASQSNLVGSKAKPSFLQGIASATEGLSSYMLSSLSSELPAGWSSTVINSIETSNRPTTASNSLMGVLYDLSRSGRQPRDVYDRRGLVIVLKNLWKYVDDSENEALQWLSLVRRLPEGSPLGCAVLHGIREILIEQPQFVRYQNELASVISGIAPNSARTRGNALLEYLLATAPQIDSATIFLPQHRSLLLLQGAQKWITEDNDLDEQSCSLLALLFLHLAPIVQDLEGSHWDFIFNILELNLELASWDDYATFQSFYHSCRLLLQLVELTNRNPELKEISRVRIEACLYYARDLFVDRPASQNRGEAAEQILETLSHLLQGLPDNLLTMGGFFDKLVHLLSDESLAVQQSSFELLTRIVNKHVNDVVVDAELDTEDQILFELPTSLIDVLKVSAISVKALETETSSFLFAWLITFQFFKCASPKVKVAYNDQLRSLNIIPTIFLPKIFDFLRVSDRGKGFDAGPWAIDEFQLSFVEELDSTNLMVFGVFVYYRALQTLPSMVRIWWESIRNRQFSIAVSQFTSKYISPLLISHELNPLRDPDDSVGQALRDTEDFSVKVASAVNEVRATYVVDEQTMEICIRIPSEYPLQGVEVKDVQKVGVSDGQWRAWLLAVQQVITAQNGLISDALSLFKRNVVLHFEGVVACAICYSIISVVDRSLPRKSCRTCKNTFHAGCLFKWFSTSHGSSCPMCRSLF